MAHAYTPGLKVSRWLTHQCKRMLPIQGDVLVEVGQTVDANDIVAQTAMPGDVYPINMANLLSLPPADVPECLVKKEGDPIEKGELLAQTKGIFGMMKKSQVSPYSGTIETVSEITGQLILRGPAIPIQVRAYVSGRILEVLPNEGCVIETQGTYLQGIFGIGGETSGNIRMACERHDQMLTDDLIKDDMKDCIVVGGGQVTDAAIERAVAVGVAAIVSGGIDDQDLKDFLGYDLGVAITGSERKGITIVITEGFGDIAMANRSFELLQAREGRQASVNGATQIRAGVMRPEIIVPLKPDESPQGGVEEGVEGLLAMGRPVRIIRDPYFGEIGQVAGLPPQPAVLGSGSKARVLEVKLDSGESVVIPRANVELIEG